MIPLMKNTFFYEKEVREALADFILSGGRLSMDTECARFESEFAQFQGVTDAVLFNSGGSANLAMLQTLKNTGKVHSGDKVGFSALTWSTNVMPIIQLGLEPVPVDCDTSTLNVMSPQLSAALKRHRLKVLFITNALGFSGDLHEIRRLCQTEGVTLIEDNCEALGTELDGSKTGTFGEMASFSFFVAHHMSTIEGGMVCTSDEEYGQMLRLVRANGWDRNLNSSQQIGLRRAHKVRSEFYAKYTFYDLGYNLRPTEITGYLGRYQLKHLEENIQQRQANYVRLESTVKENPDLVLLDRRHISLLSSFAFPVICKSQELKRVYFENFSGAGVEIRPVIAGNIQRQPFFKKYVDKKYDLEGADRIDECGFYCGNYPELSENDLQTLTTCLSKY